jgi:hypothetical protein
VDFMHRNLVNRWWTITLACAIGLALLFALPGRSLAGSVLSAPGGVPDAGTGPPPDPGASGDPDSPSNTGRSNSHSSPVSPAPVVRQTPIVSGGAWGTPAVWTIRVRYALQMVRVFYLRD